MIVFIFSLIQSIRTIRREYCVGRKKEQVAKFKYQEILLLTYNCDFCFHGELYVHGILLSKFSSLGGYVRLF